MTAAEDLACKELTELATEYLEGALPPGRAQVLEEHLRICPGCLEYVEQLRQSVRVAGKLAPEALSPTARNELLAAFRAWRDAAPE